MEASAEQGRKRAFTEPSGQRAEPQNVKENTVDDFLDSLAMTDGVKAPGKTETTARVNKWIEETAANTNEEKENHLTSTLYPKILKLSDLVYKVTHKPEYEPSMSTLNLIGTIKLHGTHADIVFASATSENYRLQSRNQLELILGAQDNHGFAAFVNSLKPTVVLNLRDRIVAQYHELDPERPIEGEIIVAGEWCGKGVQKKVAVSKVDKFLAIISIKINGQWVFDPDYLEVDDEENRIYHIGRAGFFEQKVDLENTAEAANEIKKLVNEVVCECPFAKDVFGKSGPGEGLVWKASAYCGDPTFWFKSKGDQYAVSHVDKFFPSPLKKKNPESSNTESSSPGSSKPDAIENFAIAVTSELRLEQGWGYLTEKKAESLETFVKWVLKDCMEEEAVDMARLRIPEKRLKTAIVKIAEPWFLDKLKAMKSEKVNSPEDFDDTANGQREESLSMDMDGPN